MAALTSAWSSGDNGAEPDTQSRSRPSAPARPDAANRWYMVGTPKNSEARWSVGGVGHTTRVEAGEEHRRAPGQQGAVDAHAQAVGVEDGQAVDQPVVGTPPPGGGDRHGGGQQVPVAQHGALGRAGGAGRVSR